jgi:hypothetical protein
MNRAQKILVGLLAATIALACSTAQTLINGTPTLIPPTATGTPTLVPSATATLTIVPTLDWTPIPCDGEECIEACMERVEIIMQDSPFQSVENELQGDTTNYDLASYPVEGDEIGEVDSLWVPQDYKILQDDLETHAHIWEYFTAVIPPEVRRRVDRLTIFTDGSRNKLAWVKPTKDQGELWTIGFDIADADYPPYLTETLVHEVGHLVTLNAGQLALGDDNPLTCETYLLYEGCSYEDSYINLFYQQFWPDIYEEWQQVEGAASEAEFRAMVANFYGRHASEFISGYAATSPVEDIAESWMTFVLKPRPEGRSTAEEKVLFFYDFPELVDYREQIIGRLCSYVQ